MTVRRTGPTANRERFPINHGPFPRFLESSLGGDAEVMVATCPSTPALPQRMRNGSC